jgi:transposase
MVREPGSALVSEVDLLVFASLVPADHKLRRALEVVDFERLRPRLAVAYSPDQGRPADDPVRLLKLSYLQFADRLSDRQVIARTQTDVAYRYFLGLTLQDALPDPSTLTYFRGRQGVEGFQAVFQDILTQAREHGVLRDRLRLKDATHLIADIAVPTTLALVAQTRERLLAAAAPWDGLRVAGEQTRVQMIRDAEDGVSNEERLLTRVTHLREILAWVDLLPIPEDPSVVSWQELVKIRQLAHKILADREHPEAKDKTLSLVDPDARQSKHGDWFDGYLLDVLEDPDSELITAVGVLPGNGDEAGDAAALLQSEEAAQGNDVPALSIDGVGFQGPVLRDLEDPQGLGVKVYVPPKAEPPTTVFPPEKFVEDRTAGTVTCPAGETTASRERNERDTAWAYRFSAATCVACPLRSQCLARGTASKSGRKVNKNDYETEYQRARQRATTADYREVRKKHPKIERKLAELTRQHGARRARYRGRWKVLCQALLTALVVNVKRLVHLHCAPMVAGAGT